MLVLLPDGSSSLMLLLCFSVLLALLSGVLDDDDSPDDDGRRFSWGVRFLRREEMVPFSNTGMLFRFVSSRP